MLQQQRTIYSVQISVNKDCGVCKAQKLQFVHNISDEKYVIDEWYSAVSKQEQ